MARENRKLFSWKTRLKSFQYAFSGIAYMFKTQHNSWIQATIAGIAFFLGFYLKISLTGWGIIILATGLVFTAELINTSIESLVDLISPEMNEKAGRIKDLAAGGVLLASISALVAGIMIFLPKILEY
jgi:diacylglycerol kinase (ATP)